MGAAVHASGRCGDLAGRAALCAHADWWHHSIPAAPEQHNISVRELEAYDEHDVRPHMASYGSVFKNGLWFSYVKTGGEFGLGEAITAKELHVASTSDVALAKEAAAAAAL